MRNRCFFPAAMGSTKSRVPLSKWPSDMGIPSVKVVMSAPSPFRYSWTISGISAWNLESRSASQRRRASD